MTVKEIRPTKMAELIAHKKARDIAAGRADANGYWVAKPTDGIITNGIGPRVEAR